MNSSETPNALNVLLMEDDVDQAMMIKDHIEGSGNRVTVCTNGTDAIALLGDIRFDVVIADIFVKGDGNFVPDGGYLLINRIRQTRRPIARATSARVPIIAISGGYAFGDINALTSAETMGANISLQKPFSLEDLTDAMTAAVASAAPVIHST